jgi:hypothetical protein
MRTALDSGRIAEEVIAHPAAGVGADVDITLEIKVVVPESVPEQLVRIAAKNCPELSAYST